MLVIEWYMPGVKLSPKLKNWNDTIVYLSHCLLKNPRNADGRDPTKWALQRSMAALVMGSSILQLGTGRANA
jgi:hypothetical protein